MPIRPADAATFAWSAEKSTAAGDADGWIAPALSFANGRTGLETTDSDLLVEQNLPAVYLRSNTGGLLDLGAVDFSKVTPVTGNLTQKVSAVAGHVYLFRAGNTVAKVHLIQVIPGERQYSMPTVYLRFAAGSLDPAAVLPDVAGADFGKQPTGQPNMAWSSNRLMGLGDVGGWIQPGFNLAAGRTGLESTDSDLVVSQSWPPCRHEVLVQAIHNRQLARGKRRLQDMVVMWNVLRSDE